MFANATVWAALGVLLALLAGCGAAPAQRPPRKMAPYAADPDVVRYPKSLRLAALGRVHQRAGFDALAAEYFRGAYRSYPELNYMLDYAQASERARHFAEAHAAYSEALQHDLDEDQRNRLTGETERLKTLVSPSLVPVTVQVQPLQAKVLFTQVDGGDQQRMVLGDGTVWLRPGTYNIESQAPNHKGEKRQFRVGVNERQMLTVHLRRDAVTPVALLASKGARPVPVERAPVAVQPAKPVPTAAVAATVAAPSKPAAQPEAPVAVAAAEPAKPAAEPAKPAAEPAKPAAALAPVTVEPQAPAEKPAAAPAEKPDEEPAPAVAPPEEPDDKVDEPADEEEAAEEDEGEEDEGEEADEIIEDAAPASGSGGGLSTWGPVITAGLGVAALGAGGYFGQMALTHVDYADGLNVKSPNYDKNFDSEAAAAQDNATYATYSFIGGGALVGVGTIWFVLSRVLGSSAALPAHRGDAIALKPAGVGFDGRRFIAAWRF